MPRARQQPRPETLVAVGLTVVGFLSHDPIAAVVGTLGGIGGNLIASLVHEGYQYWRAGWLTEYGALNQDIANALGRAFEKAVRKLEEDWKGNNYYRSHLGQTDQQLTLAVLHDLRKDSKIIFTDMNRLKAALDDNDIPSLLNQDEAHARLALGSALEAYLAQCLYGHDTELVSFVPKRLPDEWLLSFREELVDGTRAWRSYQQLWQRSLVKTVIQIGQNTDQVKQDTARILDIVRQLQDSTPKQGQVHRLEGPDHNIHSYVQDVLHSFLVGAIVEEIHDEDDKKRTAAAQKLAVWKNPFTVPILARRLMVVPELLEPDPTVRHWLAYALGEIGGEEACAALQRAKAHETNLWALTGIERGLQAANCESRVVKH
jgi:hypothetical protein